MASSTVSKKISTLAQIAQELRQGKDFNITRLTSLKSLCADPQAAGQFCLHLAQLTQQNLQDQEKPDHLEEGTWLNCKNLINEAVSEMEMYLAEPTKEKENLLQNLLSRVKEVNNQYKNQNWGLVRIIQSTEVLLIEKALYGVLRPSESSYWGYQIAREYAERYNSRYGNGLIPESAPMVEDIANFWSQYYFGKPVDD
ncbi:MAG: hypothetical protein HY785_22250 [Oscillatoriophycideae cyanobacterium NC_groundwater_1537_Pr4_S-0.65um_50_18]|nr:hypothetical protein [Oscillatoriophycideae cyanobacterium NC_groundwater_1537_Pr4_S-0.65um_50_18]